MRFSDAFCSRTLRLSNKKSIFPQNEVRIWKYERKFRIKKSVWIIILLLICVIDVVKHIKCIHLGTLPQKLVFCCQKCLQVSKFAYKARNFKFDMEVSTRISVKLVAQGIRALRLNCCSTMRVFLPMQT